MLVSNLSSSRLDQNPMHRGERNLQKIAAGEETERRTYWEWDMENCGKQGEEKTCLHK